MNFRDLRDGLHAAKVAGLVSVNQSGSGLQLYCYTRECVYDRKWDDITTLARGLIIAPDRGEVVATPFPKFFNVGEGEQTIPELPFETFEKLDGSLIIIFHDDERWRAATKGSFASEQAGWAQRWLDRHDLSCLTPGTTYLAEAIYPENRIVVHYAEQGLVLLGAYDAEGRELSYADICAAGASLGWRAAKRHEFASIVDLLAHTKGLPPSEEGFVIRFANGLRLKAKGDEYRRIHALVSRLTPLAMWEAMEAGDDLVSIRRDLPEEFWADFDQITAVLQTNADRLVTATRVEAQRVLSWSDKELGLSLDTIPEPARHFLFAYRKNGGDLLSGRQRRALFRHIRPTGNRLEGYTPSYAMNRVMEEAI